MGCYYHNITGYNQSKTFKTTLKFLEVYLSKCHNNTTEMNPPLLFQHCTADMFGAAACYPEALRSLSPFDFLLLN